MTYLADALERELRDQLARLESLARGVGEVARPRLPEVDELRWHGPARWAYEAALDALGRRLAAAAASVERARGGTARALAILGERDR
jgi:hypothetical protein